uniref:Uncharacterized protein n=1 Tax=Fagus sylvatica TaxID=28930 RepID=A0A2N9HFY1_FAGSY
MMVLNFDLNELPVDEDVTFDITSPNAISKVSGSELLGFKVTKDVLNAIPMDEDMALNNTSPKTNPKELKGSKKEDGSSSSSSIPSMPAKYFELGGRRGASPYRVHWCPFGELARIPTCFE